MAPGPKDADKFDQTFGTCSVEVGKTEDQRLNEDRLRDRGWKPDPETGRWYPPARTIGPVPHAKGHQYRLPDVVRLVETEKPMTYEPRKQFRMHLEDAGPIRKRKTRGGVWPKSRSLYSTYAGIEPSKEMPWSKAISQGIASALKKYHARPPCPPPPVSWFRKGGAEMNFEDDTPTSDDFKDLTET